MDVIDRPVVFVSGPSFESMLTKQGGFWVGAALILLIYLRPRTWWGQIWVLILILLVLIGVCFVEFFSLFAASLLDLREGPSVQLTNRVQ